MLPSQMDVPSIAAARQVLERFALPERLQHVRQFVWRGGTLRLEVDEPESNVCYALLADWEAAVLQDVEPGVAALARRDRALVEGRWSRARAGYALRAGIDLAVPSAI